MQTIIWGTGGLGRKAFYKIDGERQIIGFCDNNSEKWGGKFMDLPVYSLEETLGMRDIDIVVASTYYDEIIDQILDLGGQAEHIYYINSKSYLIHKLQSSFFAGKNYKMRILFVQAAPGIRIDKIAYALQKKGVQVDMAYLSVPPNLCLGMQKSPYEKIIPINDLQEFLDYVDREDYDLVWSANEPDYLTTLLINSNKRIIHDTADMMSLRGDVTAEQLIHEYTANKKSAANVYVTDLVQKIAIEKFGIERKKMLILNNYVLKEEKPKKYYQKLSESDLQIHCVYEGGISNNPRQHRYYEWLFTKIAENRVHVHFYGNAFTGDDYCDRLASTSPYLHYEGCISYERLQTELTKYDVGLVLLNITQRNNTFLQTTFPNKIFEYLYAGLPVAVSHIDALIQFARKYEVGDYLDFNKDIKKQIEAISHISIEKDFLEKNRLTMDDKVDDIIQFFEQVLQ